MLKKGQIIEVTMLDDQKAIYQNDVIYINNAFNCCRYFIFCIMYRHNDR